MSSSTRTCVFLLEPSSSKFPKDVHARSGADFGLAIGLTAAAAGIGGTGGGTMTWNGLPVGDIDSRLGVRMVLPEVPGSPPVDGVTGPDDEADRGEAPKAALSTGVGRSLRSGEIAICAKPRP
jgi:hypothetical protein